MNKLKLALTLFTVAIIVGPLAYVLVSYRDNLIGLVLPPQLSSVGQDTAQTGTIQNPSPDPLDSLGVNTSDVQMPQLIGEPQYNPDTGELNVAINATNPLDKPISVEQLSVQVLSKDNSGLVGTISIPQSINIQPGQSAVINVSGIIPEELYKQLSGQSGNVDLNNIEFRNLDATVGGIKIHMDQFDASSLQELGGQ